jgi:hypothetical protein
MTLPPPRRSRLGRAEPQWHSSGERGEGTGRPRAARTELARTARRREPQGVRVLAAGGALPDMLLHAARLRRAGRGGKPGCALALAGARSAFSPGARLGRPDQPQHARNEPGCCLDSHAAVGLRPSRTPPKRRMPIRPAPVAPASVQRAALECGAPAANRAALPRNAECQFGPHSWLQRQSSGALPFIDRCKSARRNSLRNPLKRMVSGTLDCHHFCKAL